MVPRFHFGSENYGVTKSLGARKDSKNLEMEKL